MKKVLILAPYPAGKAPSQRFRFEHYLPFFKENNLTCAFQSFWSLKAWNILYKKGHYFQKFYFLIVGFLRRFQILFTIFKYDFIFIHREVAPIGPPVFEFIIAMFFRKRIIYDFDDAIWLPNTSSVNSISALLKFHHKVAYICEMSWKVSVGNRFLQDYAQKFNEHVIINPTVVDTEKYHVPLSPKIKHSKPVIGWTGTHSTSIYLKKVDKLLSQVMEEAEFELVVISNQPPDLKYTSFTFIPWEKDREIDQLNSFDIGIMPLEDNLWEEGKCGFKIIQYFALGIPAIASPVGVNREIIDHGMNGYLTDSSDEWKTAIRSLLSDENLRIKMGKSGREKVIDHYSLLNNKDLFFSAFA